MNTNDVPEIYDEDYAQKYNKRFLLNEESKNNADFEQETINKLLSEIGEEPKWLDVACGTGYFLSCFPNIERAGLDISPAMLNVAKQTNPDVLFVQGDYRDERPQWQGQWDLVSCMWWAYSYVESLTQLEKVFENLADWTSERGICFLPVCDPAELGAGELKLPYTSKHIGEAGGYYRFEGVIWSWIDEEAEKHHLNLLAPQVEYMATLLKKYFEQVEVIEYPSFCEGQRKAIVARSKKQKHTVKPIVSEIESAGLFSSFSKIVRGGNWWLYKIPPLLAIAYGEIILMDIPPIQSILTVLVLLFSISSVAAYGHIVNDIFDIEVDKKAGKSNSIAQFSPWQRLLFCILFAVTGFVLPIVFNFGTWAVILLGINYLLPTIYSAPPLRLKEKGIWGVITDAGGAHLVPTLFVAATFLSFTPQSSRNILIFTGLAATHAFFVGLRGILLHQLWDRDKDEKSGTTTFVSQRQPETVRRWIAHFVFPVEIALLVSVAVILSLSEPWLIPFFVAYFAFTIAKLKATKTPLDPSPTVRKNIVPHDLYEVWLPLALAMLLSSGNPHYLGFVTLTLVLFFPSVKNRLLEIVNVFKTFLVADNSPPKIVSGTEARFDTEQEPEDTNDDEIEVNKANVKNNIKNQILTNVSPLTPEMQRQLETEGYVIIEDFLTTTELQNLRDLVSNELVPDNTCDVSTYTLFSQNDPSFRQHHNNRLKTIVNAKLSTLIPGYRTAFCTWYIKSPNSSTNTTPLHQDPSLTAEPHTLGFGIWCPLIDVDPGNGCLHVVKGSHKLNAQPRPVYQFSPFPYNDDIATLVTDHYLTHIPLKAGQAILYDKRLFHGATANPTAAERVAFTCLICPESQPTQFVYRSNSNSKTVEIYEVQDDFYNRYILGEKPDGDGVNLIGTEDYTYDPITPQIIAEVLKPLHQETSTNNSLVTTQSPSSMPTTQHQTTQPTKTETDRYQDLQYIQEQAQKDNEQLQAHLEEVKTQLQNTQSELQTSKTELQTSQTELQTSQTELAQSQSELKTSKTQLAKHNSDLQYTQKQLSQSQFQLQQTQTKLTQSQSQLQTTQTELVQLKTYLQQTHGEQGLINYYRSCIASNPDDIELYHQALTIKPDDGQIHLQLGNALVRQNSFDDAIASYQTALQFHPENFEIYLELAKTFEKQNQYEQAITSYRQAIEVNPDNALAHKCLGDILAEIGQLPEATTSYRRALQLQPSV